MLWLKLITTCDENDGNFVCQNNDHFFYVFFLHLKYFIKHLKNKSFCISKLATESLQLFGLEDTEPQEVARHIGHELAVYRRFYRLQDDVIELAQISKLLLAVESGRTHQYSGMSIDDIHLDGSLIFFVSSVFG